MKKKIVQIIIGIMCLLLIGCGQEHNGSTDIYNNDSGQQITDNLPDVIVNNMTEDEGYYDIKVEEVGLSVHLLEEEFILGTWYEGQDSVWLVGNHEGSVYSFRLGEEKELLLEGGSPTYVNAGAMWRMIGEDYYVLSGSFLVVLTKEGELNYRIVLGKQERLQGICTTESGRIVIAIYNADNDNTKLMELDTKAQKLVEKDSVQIYYGMTGGVKDNVMVMSGDGLCSMGMLNGEESWHMKWKGTTYDPNAGNGKVRDIRLTEDGKATLIIEDTTTNKWMERELSRVSFESLGKHILVYKTSWAGAELKEVIAGFNKENTDYYVYLDEKETETAYIDFVEQTGIEIATGKGPDIIDISAVENIYSLAKKGVFEDLQPYMQRSGMRSEDYFSAALRDFEVEGSCYGFTYGFYLNTMYMMEEYVADVGSIEALLDVLEGCEENMVFSEKGQYSSRNILYYFLRMSEDMYGMLDWESGTCDFGGELWGRMLEVAKRYGFNERITGYESMANEVIGGTFQDFGRNDFQAREKGMSPMGYPMQTSMVNQVYEFTICMNAASKHKEGVWEFLEYLMSQKGQEILSEYYFAVLKSEFEEDYREELANPSIIDVVNHEGIYTTEEQVNQVVSFLENAKQDPIRTEYVWSIISEEVENYFSGEKTIEQVTEVIENRISMYMAENM